MKTSKKFFQIMIVALFAISFTACTEDETMNELMETVEKYDLEDQSNDKEKKKDQDPMGN